MLKPEYLNQQISMWLYKFTLSIVFSFVFISCNNSNKTITGGPCTYDSKHEKLVVKSIQLSKSNSNISFINTTILDTLAAQFLYSDYMQSTIDSATASKIKVGDTCLLQIDKIKTGSCTPQIYTIILHNNLSNQ
jgi:hypothetical protein